MPSKPNSSKTVLQILQKARALVARGWTRHVLAKNARGKLVDSSSRTAVCFCAMGAFYRAGGLHSEERRKAQAVFTTANDLNATGISAWNDKRWRTQAQVVRAFDKAIATTQAQA